MILNSEQARALRNADSVCFDYSASEGGANRAIKRANDNTGEGERTFTIPGVDTRVEAFDGVTVVHCFDMVMSAQVTPEWRTIAKRLKIGTDVRLKWVRGNSSPVMDKAGFVVDYLNIVLNGDEYRVRDYVGPDNSIRMTRVR